MLIVWCGMVCVCWVIWCDVCGEVFCGYVCVCVGYMVWCVW